MPSYLEIQQELEKAQQDLQKTSVLDVKRRGYIRDLAAYTGRDTVVYAMANSQLIDTDDIQFFMSAFHGLKGDKLDLIIHSGGGRSEATEQIVNYLRKKYTHVRAVIPDRAMSAATMLSCACDEIIMGKQSAIGPIDPQLRIDNAQVAAHAILEDYARALEDIKADPKAAALWAPKLMRLPIGMQSICNQTIERSHDLVADWLHRFGKLTKEKADEIAKWLAEYKHQSHSRPIDADTASAHGLNIKPMETDQKFQDLVLSIFHCTMLTFQTTPTVKLTENDQGRGLYMQAQQQQIMIPGHPFQVPFMPGSPPVPGQPMPGQPVQIQMPIRVRQNPQTPGAPTPNVRPVIPGAPAQSPPPAQLPGASQPPPSAPPGGTGV